MIFSIPNLKEYLKNKWINYLSFEHTILLTEAAVEFLLAKHNFKIKAKQYFGNHSIFYCAEKNDKVSLGQVSLKNEYEENKELFFQMHDYYKYKIQDLNLIFKQNKTKNIYLFGAHIFSQYLIYRGLAVDKIKMILDNNPNKHKKRLYGTNLWVDSPEILKDDSQALVVLNAGVYNQEIKKEILKLNDTTEVIECH